MELQPSVVFFPNGLLPLRKFGRGRERGRGWNLPRLHGKRPSSVWIGLKTDILNRQKKFRPGEKRSHCVARVIFSAAVKTLFWSFRVSWHFFGNKVFLSSGLHFKTVTITPTWLIRMGRMQLTIFLAFALKPWLRYDSIVVFVRIRLVPW